MAFIVILFVIAAAALAPRFGTDSRDLGARHEDSLVQRQD